MPHAMLPLFFLIPCVTSIVFYLFSLYSASAFFSGKDGMDHGFTPAVSVLRSVCGADTGTYENLASFCRQDYPQFQILLAVHDPEDPAVPVIRKLIRDFPGTDVRMFLCPRIAGANPKISNLMQVDPKARYPLLLVCDSDIRVERDFLRRVVQPMRNPGVGAVTCMCRSLSKGWIGTLEGLRESTEFCPRVLVAGRGEGVKFGLGSAILVRREALDRIGGLASIADYLADDFLLGNRIAGAGFRVALSETVVEHQLSLGSIKSLVRRQLRWNRGIRVCRPWGYRGLFFTYGVPMSLLLLLAAGGTAPAWGVLAAAWVVRLFAAYWIGARALRDRAARRFLWMVPLQDLFSFTLWFMGLSGQTIHWRDRVFRLTGDGKLIPAGGPARAVSAAYNDETVVAAAQ